MGAMFKYLLRLAVGSGAKKALGGKKRIEDMDNIFAEEKTGKEHGSYTGRANNAMWLLDSTLKFAESNLPTVVQQAKVIAVGFPWSNVDSIYNFAVSVAFGLMEDFAVFSSSYIIDAQINHTEKTVKIEIGYQSSGTVDFIFAGGGGKLMRAPVREPIVGGKWDPRFCGGAPADISVVDATDPEGKTFLVSGKVVATDVMLQNAKLPVDGAVGQYAPTDLMLQVPDYNLPCANIESPPTVISTPASVVFKLLGIS